MSDAAQPIKPSPDPVEMAAKIATLQQELDDRTAQLAHVSQTLQQEIAAHRHTDALLQESQRRFAGIFHNSFNLMGLLAPDGTILEANQTALNYAGVSHADAMGCSFWGMPWCHDMPESQAMLRTAIAQAAGGEVVRREVVLRSSTGPLEPFDFSLTPVKDETGQTIFLVAEGREISDPKQTAEALYENE